jgi:hypothetical protein
MTLYVNENNREFLPIKFKDCRLKCCIKNGNSKGNSTGRKSRDKSIIDVLIFGNGHVLHDPPTLCQNQSNIIYQYYHS